MLKMTMKCFKLDVRWEEREAARLEFSEALDAHSVTVGELRIVPENDWDEEDKL